MSSESETRGLARGPGVWIMATRAPFLTASVIPALMGAFAAFWRTGSLSASRLGLTLGGVACLHIGANLANDYFDEITGCDRANREPTAFSGGSRVIQEGLLPASIIMIGAAVFFAAGLAQGLLLNRMVQGNGVIYLGLAGLACGLAYTAVPLKLSYRGFGEVVVFMAFGPLLVAGAYLAQTGSVNTFAIAVSIPAGLLVLSILMVNEVLDEKWDRLARKLTLVVILGRRRGYLAYLAAYAAAYAWLGVGVAAGVFPLSALLALVVPVAVLRHLRPRSALCDRGALVRASGLTTLSQAISGTVIALSFLLQR